MSEIKKGVVCLKTISQLEKHNSVTAELCCTL